MELRKGYKKSIYGQIPKDWIECKFEDVFTGFSSGQTPYRAISRYYEGNIPWITSGELNYNKVDDTIEKITEEAVKKTNLKILPKGTFLFAITGLEAEGTRGSCAVTDIEATTNQSCMALFPKPGLVSTDYLFQFYVKYGNWLAFNYCQGTKQQSYTGGIAKKLPFILPPTIEEQTVIATALSDMDNLIAGLEKLIEKKKAIKQGAMQELLRPKEGWVVKRLGDLGEIIGGGTPSSFNPQYWNGSINWFTPTEVGFSKYLAESERKITKVGLESSSARILPEGAVLLTTRAGIGDVGILKSEAATNQGFQSVVVNDKNDNEYVYYLLTTLKSELLRNASGSTFLEISPGKLKSIEVCLPRKSEQCEISRVLCDLDNEIEGLKNNLRKYKLLKQGMMQELLTGKIRLI